MIPLPRSFRQSGLCKRRGPWEGINHDGRGVEGAVVNLFERIESAAGEVKGEGYEPASVVLRPRDREKLLRLCGYRGEGVPGIESVRTIYGDLYLETCELIETGSFQIGFQGVRRWQIMEFRNGGK